MKNRIYLTLLISFLSIPFLNAQQSQMQNLQMSGATTVSSIPQSLPFQNNNFSDIACFNSLKDGLPVNRNDYYFAVYDATGKRLYIGKNKKLAHFEKFPVGFFILKVYCNSGTWTKEIWEQD